MTRLSWNLSEAERRYENGLNRGVLYPFEGPGVPWNGLISVDQGVLGAERTSLYFDGVKFYDLVAGKDFQGTLTAFQAPPEFGPSIGERVVVPGFILTRQLRLPFGLSYQTRIQGDAGYKIHLLYGVTASPTQRAATTLGAQSSPDQLGWTLDAVPQDSSLFRPSAYLVVDSTKIDYSLLFALERMLYGSGEEDPFLPSVATLLEFFGIEDDL